MSAEAMPFELRYSATVAETVFATGVSRSKIWKWIRDGEIETIRADRRRLIVVQSMLSRLKRPCG